MLHLIVLSNKRFTGATSSGSQPDRVRRSTSQCDQAMYRNLHGLHRPTRSSRHLPALLRICRSPGAKVLL